MELPLDKLDYYDRRVLDELNKWPSVLPSQMARILNLKKPCSWCPVGPPKKDKKCATVPRTSRDLVWRILEKLCRLNLVTKFKGRVTYYISVR